MAVPQYDDLMNPTLKALKLLGGTAHIRDIEKKVSELINLSDEDLKEIHRGSTTKLVYRLAWSRNYLKRFGLLTRMSRGIWSLTPEGGKIINVDKEEVKRKVKLVDLQMEDIEDDFEDFISSLKFKEIDENETLELDVFDENTFSENEDIVSPFDPKDIKIIVEPKTIDHLVTRLRYDEIDLNTEFQRKGNLWRPEAQSRLIESILLRLPLPAFYFDAEDENKWLVVDGLQRLWSIRNFIINPERNDVELPPLTLKGLEILTDLNNSNVTFFSLSRTLQRRILETPITTYLIQPGTPKQVKYNVFRRINTGGLALNSMEIRNALNQGKPSNFLKELSENPRFKELLKVQDKRMEDRELILRAYSFINKNFNDYKSPLSTFLDHAMETLAQKNIEDLNILSDGIILAIQYQQALFGKHMFSRSILGGGIKVKLNSALFEVWVSEVYKMPEGGKQKMLDNKRKLIESYQDLLMEERFFNAVSTSTSGKSAVLARFEGIRNLIKKYSE